MKKSIDSLAAQSARRAQSQMAMMRRDLKALRDNIAAMGRGISAPVIRTKRKTIKGSSSTSIWGGIAGIAETFLIDSGIYGDMDVKASGKVMMGGVTYSRSASYTGGGDNSSDDGGAYTSASQSASSALAAMAQAQRNR
jgi:hypothetical protein